MPFSGFMDTLKPYLRSAFIVNAAFWCLVQRHELRFENAAVNIYFGRDLQNEVNDSFRVGFSDLNLLYRFVK